MTYQTAIMRPTSLISSGTGVTTVGGSLPGIFSDDSDLTYVQYASGCRNPDQVLKLGFGALALPAGAQVQSVTLQERVLTVTGVTSPPQCYFGLYCNAAASSFLTTLATDILKLLWFVPHPQTTIAQWVNTTIRSSKTGPDGLPWTAATFAGGFVLEVGRTDTLPAARWVSEVSLLVNYNVQATLTATGPTSPVTDTATPTVSWTYVNSDGLPQADSQVCVYTAAQVALPGFTPFTTPAYAGSGRVLGDQTQWICDTPLPNGSYTAYVRARQSWDGPTDFYATLSSITWTQSITACPDATLSSAVWQPATNTVAVTAVPSSASPTTDFFRFEASRNGAPFAPVYGADAVAANGMTPVVIVDNQAPSNVPTTYRVLSFKVVSGVAQPAAAYSNTLNVTPTVGPTWWLKDLLDYLNNTPLPVGYTGDKVTQQKNFGISYVVGAESDTVYPVVIENGRFGIEGTLTLWFVHTRSGDTLWAAFDSLELSGRTLILCDPVGGLRYTRLVPGKGGQPKTWEWEMTGNAGVQYRKVTVSYVEVGMP